MKKKMISFTLLSSTVFILIGLFVFSEEIKNTILFGFNIFLYNIFPSLFPFFIISNFLINIGVVSLIANIFKKPMEFLFKINGESSFVFFLSILSGSPSNAKYIKDLLDQGLIDINEANKILCYTFFVNPLFIVNTVGIAFLNNKTLGYLILIIEIIVNIIIALLFRNIFKINIKSFKTDFKTSLKKLHNNINNTNLFSSILNSISTSITSLISIMGTIIFFLIILTLITSLLNLKPLNNTLLSGVIEMTTGLKKLSILNLNIHLKVIISIFFISFGGLSIHAQIFNILSDYKIKYYPFLLSRVIHASLSILIYLIMVQLF